MTETRPSNRFVVQPDWEYTRSRDRNGTIFAFHSSDTCPGYSIHISNWRLRKNSARINDEKALRDKAYSELERCAGDLGFAETNKIKEEIDRKTKAIIASAGLLRPDFLARIGQKYQALLNEYEEKLFIASIKDTLSPWLAPLSVSLMSLVMRDKAEYVVDSVPWSFKKPPIALQHLAKTGFNSRFGWGIIALPWPSDDVWVVSKFSQCEVEPQWNRPATIKKEFPWLDELSDFKGSMSEATKQLSVVPAVIAENERVIREQQERLAFLQQAITSSVRTALELSEQKIARRKNDLCLDKLSDEEMLLFLFLTGYRWKREQKKVFSKRKICWALGFGSDPHPELVSRKEAELRDKYQGIGPLIDSFRAQNIKGERRDKRKEVSFDGMGVMERRKLGLDDANEED